MSHFSCSFREIGTCGEILNEKCVSEIEGFSRNASHLELLITMLHSVLPLDSGGDVFLSQDQVWG